MDKFSSITNNCTMTLKFIENQMRFLLPCSSCHHACSAWYSIECLMRLIILQGRPYGGRAILFRKSLIGSISMVSTNSKWFCAIRLSDQTGHILLIICVYLPTDYMVLHPHMMSFSLFLVSLKVLYTQNPLTVS